MNEVKPIPIEEFDPDIHMLPIADTGIRTGDRVMIYTLNELRGSEGTKTYPTQVTLAPDVSYFDSSGIAAHDAEEGEALKVITNLDNNPHVLIVTEV